ncbi:unnamed protein product [Urochloa humidicola]
MEAGSSSSSRGTGEFTVFGLTQKDDKHLVDSTIPFRRSVVRIIRVSKEDVIETSTAFLVFRVKGDVPENPCVEFSTDKIEQHDKVILVGYTTPIVPLPDRNGELVQLLVKEPGLHRGRINTTFIREDIQEYYEKITYNVPIGGESVEGAPLFRDGKVIGVHLSRDGRNRRDGVSARTVLQVLREWLGVGENNQGTINELLQIVYDKIKPKVPNVELPSYRKKLRSESKKEEGLIK